MPSPEPTWTRRHALAALAAGVAIGPPAARAGQGGLKLATFAADVTIPLGHPCMGGGIEPARSVADPLEARGLVLIPDAGRPIVIVAVDWCEIRNDAYERWRTALADAAGTEPRRVLVTSVHQHDAPVADLTAERLLREQKATGRICVPDFHEEAVLRVARALRSALAGPRPVSHVGTGSAPVEQIASNRRYTSPDGSPAFDRGSATRDAYAREQPEGTIDPLLRSLSFWDGDRAIAVLNAYATHPMSYYGRGQVSADFVGLARRRRQADEPSIFQVYLSGCSGNVTAGKYNDGAPENRPKLAERLHRAMTAASEATRPSPLGPIGFRSVTLNLEPRRDDGFSPDELARRIADDPRPFGQCLAALGLSWRRRCDEGRPIDVPCVDFGPAQLVLLPGEAYVEYQLRAQQIRPDSFVMALGYGECAPGYIPTERAVAENDTNLRDWCWVAPGAEPKLDRALGQALES